MRKGKLSTKARALLLRLLERSRKQEVEEKIHWQSYAKE